MATVKVLRKMAGQLQSGASYESNAMIALPLLSGQATQTYDVIEDESISGSAFRDVPQQGSRHTFESSLGFQLDKVSAVPLFSAFFSSPSVGVYTYASHTNKMSICTLNDIKANRYANVYLNSWALKGGVNANWTMDCGFIGATAEDRAATSNYPAVTVYDEPFTFHEAGGTSGYVRIGDTADALAAGDNIKIEDFNLSITNGFTGQWCNDGKGTLTPIFGGSLPTISGSFTFSRHDTDNPFTWADADTALQMEIMIYKSAMANLKIQLPRVKISPTLDDSDTTKVTADLMIGRNGLGTTYKNANMAFVAPIKLTLVNS
jgi:hypothetical protein